MTTFTHQPKYFHDGNCAEYEKTMCGGSFAVPPDFTHPKFSNFNLFSALMPILPLTLSALRALANVKARSNKTLNASEIRLIISSEAHYLVPITNNLSTESGCFLYEPKSRTYNRVDVDVADFTDGERPSFVAGLEVGRMSVLESRLVVGSELWWNRVGLKYGELGIDGEEDSVGGAEVALAHVLSRLALSEIPLPVSSDAPHYIVTNPKDAPGHPLWFVYNSDLQEYKHVKINLCDFPCEDQVSFAAGVKVGRRSVVDYEFDVRLTRAREIIKEDSYYGCYMSDEDYEYDEEEEDEDEDDEMDDSWLSNQFYSYDEKEENYKRLREQDLGEDWIVV